MGLSVREVEKKDETAIISIIKRTENLTQAEILCAIELLRAYLSGRDGCDYRFICASDGDLPLGYACYGPDGIALGVYDVYWIIVDSEQRGRGIGRLLMRHIETLLNKAGARKMVVETSSLPAYEAARGFYEGSGFTKEAALKDFFKLGDDKLIYVKNL
ncbi:MAG: GNAT family N-acetyltransferase [Thermodesulfobacteriota bacterium]